MPTRRNILSSLALAPALAHLGAFAQASGLSPTSSGAYPAASGSAPRPASGWPQQASKIYVGFAAGGGTDVLARLFAQRLEAHFKQPFVVENKTGASGAIAAVGVAKAPPDGHSLLMAADAHLIYPHLSTGLTYKAVDDFTPIACLSSGPQVIAVHPDVPANNLAELIALSHKDKKGLAYASGGAGTLTQMVVELIKTQSDLNITHIPFKGSGPSLIPVIAGEIPVLSSPLGIVLPHIASKKLKPIAVTSAKRTKFLPGTAAVSETKGFEGYEATSWVGLLGPKGLPADIVQAINAFAGTLATDPAFVERLDKNAWSPVSLSAADFKAKMERDSAKWKKLIDQQGIKLDA